MNLEKEVYAIKLIAGHSEMRKLCSHKDFRDAFNELACILVGWSKAVAQEQGLGTYVKGEVPGQWSAVAAIPPLADCDVFLALSCNGTSDLATAVGKSLQCAYWPRGAAEIKGMSSAIDVMQLLSEIAISTYAPVVLTGGGKAASLRLRLKEAMLMMKKRGFAASRQPLIDQIVHEFEHSSAFVATTLIPEVTEKLLCVECGCDVSGLVQEHKPGCSFFSL